MIKIIGFLCTRMEKCQFPRVGMNDGFSFGTYDLEWFSFHCRICSGKIVRVMIIEMDKDEQLLHEGKE